MKGKESEEKKEMKKEIENVERKQILFKKKKR